MVFSRTISTCPPFLGAALTATSVGITARVFRDLKKLQTKESQIVLGAAVIDDVLGLIILAVVSALVMTGSITFMSVGEIVLKAVIFLVGAIGIGMMTAPYIGKWFSKIHPGVGMKSTIVFSFGLLVAYLADRIGLAPIVGAFAAGLVLDPVHFSMFKNPRAVEEIVRCVEESDDKELKKQIEVAAERNRHRHIEELIAPIGFFLVPIFFIMTGMQVNLTTLFDVKTLGIALGVTVLAIVGKMIAGIVAGKVNKIVVGLGMVPRGEVGLIFATLGKSLGVITDEVFSIIVLMVIFTTLLTPPLLALALRRITSQDDIMAPKVQTTAHA